MLRNEDNEYDIEEVALQHYNAFQENPTNLDIAWHAIPALQRAHFYEELGTLLDIAHINFPDHLHIQLEWAQFPKYYSDLTEEIKRLSLCSLQFPAQKGDGLIFLTEQFLPLRDLEKWDELLALINNNWSLFCNTEIWVVIPALVFTLNVCGLHEKLIQLIDQFSKKISPEQKVVCGVTLSNAQTIAMTAQSNKIWKDALPQKVDIISIGQNCLPSTIAGRWGLLDDPLDFLPFDQSAFPNSSTAESLLSDFSIFANKDSFIARPFGRHARIVYHKETGVHFAHNPLPLTNYTDLFRETIQRFQARIQTFKRRTKEKNSLLFINICGDCNIDELLKVISERYGVDSHIFILNTTHSSFSSTFTPNTTYLHLPYPTDYGWNTIDDYTSDRGIAFESHIIAALKQKIQSMQK